MSDMSQPVEGASPAPEPAAPSFDMSPVLDRVGELASSIDQRFAQFEQRMPAPEPEAPEADPWAALFGTDEQPEYEQQQYEQPAPQGIDPQQLQAAINHAIEQGNAPLRAQLQEMQLERATQQLYKEIPQLAPGAENEEIRQATHQRVTQSLASYPPEIANQLAADPKYISMIFKAAEADKFAQGQAPASGAVPQTEAAGGALPGGNGAPLNPAEAAYANRDQIASGFR
jgi:hypothetical protein